MSQKFYLITSQIFQGDFNPKDLNLMLVFQVNCPGCFVYAFPLANYLDRQFAPKGLKVMGLSTAFEDYELNTAQNTKLLLETGALVGETRRILNENDYPILPYRIEFAVAFDDLQPMKNIELTDEVVEKMCQTLPDYQNLNFTEKKLVHAQVKEYLSNKKFSATTFESNNLRGTPSWILYDKEYNLYGQWFGHEAHKEIEDTIKKLLEIHE